MQDSRKSCLEEVKSSQMLRSSVQCVSSIARSPRSYRLPGLKSILARRNMGMEQSTLLGKDYPLSQSNCRIVIVGSKSGDNCLLALSHLPKEARIIATGNNLAEIQMDGEMYSEVNINLFLQPTLAYEKIIFIGKCATKCQRNIRNFDRNY